MMIIKIQKANQKIETAVKMKAVTGTAERVRLLKKLMK